MELNILAFSCKLLLLHGGLQCFMLTTFQHISIDIGVHPIRPCSQPFLHCNQTIHVPVIFPPDSIKSHLSSFTSNYSINQSTFSSNIKKWL
ncbi:hypothetical protein V6Z11_A09G107400 [Gossypium hirsutum]